METTQGALEQASQTGDPGVVGMVGGIIILVLGLALVGLVLASFWRVFARAGQPGWAALVPIYNTITLLRVAGKPGWWILLLLVPGLNLIPLISVPFGVAKRFDKSTGFALGLLLLPLLFYPILAFGKPRSGGAAAPLPAAMS